MGDTAVKFICTLWGAAVALIATRYLCAAILTAGMNPDEATFQMALNSLGPLLPILSAIALALLIGWFTLYPPEGLLFRDLSAVGSWLPLPC